jgi:uncharacterized protein YacL
MSEGFGKIVKIVFSGIVMLLSGMIGAQTAQLIFPLLPEGLFTDGRTWLTLWLPCKIFITIISSISFALIGLILSPLFFRLLGLIGTLFETHLKNTSWSEITSATIGMIVGLIIANLMALPFSDLLFGSYFAILLNIILGYLGARILLKRQNDLKQVLGPIQGLKDRLSMMRGARERQIGEKLLDAEDGARSAAGRKILDTSVIIDGRILDVARTGFLEGLIIIPQFVLLELQAVAALNLSSGWR